MSRQRIIHTTALLLASLASAAHAVEPLFHTRSYNPFTAVYGRPEFFAGSMNPAGTSEARLTMDLVSYAEIETQPDERLELDGETYRIVASFAHMLTNRWELSARVPYVHHSGGFLDDTVDRWHDVFGLPQGDRPRQGTNELLFDLTEGGQTRFLLDKSSNGGLGDVQLETRVLLSRPQADARQLALQAGVKLATGDEDQLRGSGAVDYSVGVGYSDPVTLRALRTTVSAHAGWLFLGNGNVLEEWQNDGVPFGGLQLTFAATRRLSLIAQIQGAGSYYDTTRLDTLNGTTVQLGFGANVAFPDSGWDLRFGIVEDGLSKVMPDFSLHMEVSRRFGG